MKRYALVVAPSVLALPVASAQGRRFGVVNVAVVDLSARMIASDMTLRIDGETIAAPDRREWPCRPQIIRVGPILNGRESDRYRLPYLIENVRSSERTSGEPSLACVRTCRW
jgi:hypothetical protein